MADDRNAAPRIVRIGRIVGAYGTRGWVKVDSDTQPREAILEYQPWLIGPDCTKMDVAGSSVHGNALRVALAGVTDRDKAESLSGRDIAVTRAQFPRLAADQYYWTDLMGCAVTTPEGLVLGELTGMIETGANDVMRVRGDRERLIPFVLGMYVRTVDLEARRIEVDWDPEF